MARGLKIDIKGYLTELNKRMLGAYQSHPALLREHYGSEERVLAGGYSDRQLLELVQNGADAILEAHDAGRPVPGRNRIEVLLRGSHLYVANTGAPLSKEGVDALLLIDVSPKRGRQIGRFGEGFKSLLRLRGRIDIFTRRSGAFRFDPDRCREELKSQFNLSEAPGLRLAWPLDENERTDDSTVTQLSWAETIVRAEVPAPQLLPSLRVEIASFPAEFLLFFPVDATIILDDGAELSRELRVAKDGDTRVLRDGDDVSSWLLAERDVDVTDQAAIADATALHARGSVPLAWAVPLKGKGEQAGVFWAFFPTETPTHLAGILNAPWKLNSDRTAIIGGEWNSLLMREAAKLVADSIDSLSSSEDPGRPLDAFPRQFDAIEIAAPLAEAVWAALESTAAIADGTGTLRRPYELWRHLRDSAEIAWQWQALAGPDEIVNLVHASCLEGERRRRLDVLAKRLEARHDLQAEFPRLRKCEPASWFSRVASVEIDTAKRVLELAEALKNDFKSWEWEAVRQFLRIVPSDDGQLLTANEAVFAPAGLSVPDRVPVSSALNDDAEANRILTEVMKVKTLDDGLWQSLLNEAIPSQPQQAYDAGWRDFWAKLRAAPEAVRERFVKEKAMQIRVRRRDGTWAWPEAALLPGALVGPGESSSNHNVLVDFDMHGEDAASLSALDVVEYPFGTIDADGDEVALRPWRDACRQTYKSGHPTGARSEKLGPAQLYMPSGWTLLPELRGPPNAKLTATFLRCVDNGTFDRVVDFGHRTKAGFPRTNAPHPLAHV